MKIKKRVYSMIMIGIFCVVLVKHFDEKKDNPNDVYVERVNQISPTVSPNAPTKKISSTSKEEVKENGTRDYIKNGIASFEYDGEYWFDWKGVNGTFLAYNYMNEKEFLNSTEFKKECFREGDYSENWGIEKLDYEKFKAESPELYNDIQNIFSLPEDKREEAKRRFEDAQKKYSYTVHPNTRYLFIRCEIENKISMKKEVSVNSLYCIMKAKNDRTEYPFEVVYFDKAQKDCSDPRFFAYDFLEKEKIECVIGFRIFSEKEDYDLDNADLYLGFINTNMQAMYEEGKSMYGPEYDRNMFNIRELNEDEIP